MHEFIIVSSSISNDFLQVIVLYIIVFDSNLKFYDYHRYQLELSEQLNIYHFLSYTLAFS